MSLQSFVFVAIDKLFNAAQNERKSTRFKDVDFDIKKDIVYDTSAPAAATLDTYSVKKTEGKYPVFFYIHGGGFVAGDKHYRRAHSRWAANMGFYVVNVNYGLSPEYKCPEPHRQLVRALNWVEQNAEKLNLDLDRMMVSGDSAGGYYAAALACICTNKELQAKLGVSTDAKFAGAVLNCGIYDVGVAMQQKYPFDLGGKLIIDFTGRNKNDLEGYEWSELLAIPALVTPEFPTSFITSADKDMFCGGQAGALMKVLDENGVKYEEYHSVKGKDNHCFSLNWKGEAAERNNELTADFMKRFVAGEI